MREPQQFLIYQSEDGFTSAWRYPDMTDYVEYLADVVQTSIEL